MVEIVKKKCVGYPRVALHNVYQEGLGYMYFAY